MNSLTVNATSLRAGQTLRLTANVTNTGDYSDVLLVSPKANSTPIPTNSSSVLSGQTKTIIINWVTKGMKPGYYVLTANVTTTGEGLSNLIDNTATPITILIRPAGDVNNDCVVNIIDLVLVAVSFGKSVGTPGYNLASDLNNDG